MKYIYYQIVIVIVFLFFTTSCNRNEVVGGEEKEVIDPNIVAPDNLIAHFAFEGNAVDSIEGLTPAEEARAAYVGGKRGKAYKAMDNTYFLYAIPETSKLHSLESGFTIASWIKSPQVNDSIYPQILGLVGNDPYSQGIIWQQNSLPANRNGLFFQWSFRGNDTIYWVNQTRNDSVNVKFTADAWIHIIMICDMAAKSVNVYKDGLKISDLSRTIPDMTLSLESVDKLIIGSWTGWFKGSLDELRIYNKGLTEEEAHLLYQAEKSHEN